MVTTIYSNRLVIISIISSIHFVFSHPSLSIIVITIVDKIFFWLPKYVLSFPVVFLLLPTYSFFFFQLFPDLHLFSNIFIYCFCQLWFCILPLVAWTSHLRQFLGFPLSRVPFILDKKILFFLIITIFRLNQSKPSNSLSINSSSAAFCFSISSIWMIFSSISLCTSPDNNYS